MCLIFISHQNNPEYPLIVAANRDEFFARPTRPAQFWEDHPQLLAGQDLQERGTWLGITRTGRFAAVTNIRRFPIRKAPRSRGELTRAFLIGEESPQRYLTRLASQRDAYAGFNLIVGDRSGLFYFSSDTPEPQRLAPGLYGLSNAQLDTPWPKVEEGKQAFSALTEATPEIDGLLQMLADPNQAEDSRLPDTGIGLERERLLSSRFIHMPEYGTRASTLVLQNRSGQVRFCEQNYGPDGVVDDITKLQFELENN